MGVALITPFDDKGDIDFDALANLIEYQIYSDTSYLVVCGTTAQTPTLTPAEKVAITQFVVEKVAGRIPVVLGIGGNN